ncbi:phage/plasmid replication protein, II/X family [Cellvibrio sp. UBA7661]|uniref:phage/plasmid replication protein, II/X family n=1 Tax=Cellvibrio sp. UBA7661 TaxID=1946311 RepID=UPI002F3592DE
MQQVGMIDWLTLWLDASLLDRDSMQRVLKDADRVQRINGLTGEVRWESAVREHIKSDDHNVTVNFGSRLQIQGSPARVTSSHNVFGSLDIQQCAKDMIDFVAKHHSIFIPKNLKLWSCSRIDITQNFDMGSLAQAQQAIDYLKPLKCGRQKTSTYDTSVIWGKGSTLHKGKAYLKGTQLRELVAKNNARVSEVELLKADRLLRLEYTMARGLIHRLRENAGMNWYDLTPEILLAHHSDYFSKFISTVEVVDMCNVLDKLLANVGKGENQIPTEGRARAAYRCYTDIRMNGYHIAKETYGRSAWYTHVKNLGTIGLVAADLQPINVVPLRRRQIVLDQPISSWDQINLAIGA